MNPKTESLTTPAEQPTVDHTVWDRLGIAGSIICVIHCAATPLAIGFLSASGVGFLGDEFFHKILAICLVTIAVLAFIPGFRKHGKKAVAAIGAAGALLLIVPNFLLEALISHDLELVLNILGSLLLIGAHTANWRFSSRTDCCPD